MPPSPVTSVYERKMIASATPCANTPIQNWSKVTPAIVTLSKRSGRATSTTAIASWADRASNPVPAAAVARRRVRRRRSAGRPRTPPAQTARRGSCRRSGTRASPRRGCSPRHPTRRIRSSGWNLIQSCCRSPTPIAPANASGRLVIRAITTAANEPTSRNVNWFSSRPRIGASSTPAKPASITPTIHEPAVTASVFTPAMSAFRGWSTVMPRREPDRREAQRQCRHQRDHGGAHDHRELVRVHVGAEHLQEGRVGRARHEPLGVEDLGRRDREQDLDERGERDPQTDRRHQPHRGCGVGEPAEQHEVEEEPEQRRDDEDRERRRDLDAPAVLAGQVVVEDGDRVGDGAVREVEHARRRVGEHQAQRRDRVDAADDEPADDVGRHRSTAFVECVYGNSEAGRVDPAPPSDVVPPLRRRGGRSRRGWRRGRRGDLGDLVVRDQLLRTERLAVELRHELLVLDVDVVHALERPAVDLGEVDRRLRVVEEPVGGVALLQAQVVDERLAGGAAARRRP